MRTRRLVCVALAALTALALLPAVPGQAAEEPGFDGYLVRLSDACRGEGLSLMSAADTGEEIADGICLVEDLETARALEELGVADYYEPNYCLELLEGEDYVPTQWNLLAVNAQAAWTHTDSQGQHDMLGTGVTVAVIDSGVYQEHPDFKQENFLPYHSVTDVAGGVDVWHGTFVAGVIAAQVNNGLGVDGVAPDVTLLSVCVTKNGSVTTAEVIQGIDYAIGQDVDVINISIGGKVGNTLLEEACRRAVDAGIIVVAAAGNYKSGETKSSSIYMYPASYDGVVSVSACEQSGGETVFDESYSYFNDRVTVAAPGSDVQSLYVDGGTATKEGTSFAAPVVTAMAAMAKQRSGAITPETFTQLLCASAADLGEPGYDIYYGHGLMDIEAFARVLDQSYHITYELGGADAAFPPEVQAPSAYVLSGEDLVLPQPERPGYRFLGWYETADGSGEPVTAIPAGSVGERTYYARWKETAACYFAQYDAAGRLLAVTKLSPATESMADVDVEARPGAVLGKLFWLGETGAPLRESVSARLEEGLPPAG